jgi:hypothetical protein
MTRQENGEGFIADDQGLKGEKNAISDYSSPDIPVGFFRGVDRA